MWLTSLGLPNTITVNSFPGGAGLKNPPANAGDIRNIGPTPGEGNGNPLQYSRLENPMDKGA